MSNVQVHTRDFILGPILQVSAGTNAPQSTDDKWATRTVLRIEDCACNNWAVKVDDNLIIGPRSVALMFSGWMELDNFIKGLEYAAKVLRAQNEASQIPPSESVATETVEWKGCC